MTDEALRQLSPQFEVIYAKSGGPSVPPEQLLRALLLQALYTVRSERMLVEQLEYHLLFRWFVGLGMDDAVWTPTTFTKNRERLLAGDIARQFFDAVLTQARATRLLSDEHFTVDGTLLEAFAGHKSFARTDGSSPGPSDDDPGNPIVNFHGERRSKCDASVDHRSRQSLDQEDARQRGEARVHQRSADGERAGPHRGRVCDPRDGHWRARGVAGSARRLAAWLCDPGRRHVVRHEGLGRHDAPAWRHPARRAETPQRHRCPRRPPDEGTTTARGSAAGAIMRRRPRENVLVMAFMPRISAAC